jgi:hypothetical protein
VWFDMLRTLTFLELSRRPDSFRRQIEARPRGTWVVVDQIRALMNGQIANVAGLARPTVQGCFATLVDTLIGFWLPAWRKRVRVKEVASPKFYLFDPGVARALAGRHREPVDSA